jgi:hypothetical protein
VGDLRGQTTRHSAGKFAVGQNDAAAIWLEGRMTPFLFRCPNTGFNVQGWIAETVENGVAERYESVTCLACQQLHLVNPKTGKTLGENDE